MVKTFGASRLTVNRALRELQFDGVISRRAGSGSYVSGATAPEYTFGLLIPELGQTEIFEPICRGTAELELEAPHVPLWGKSPSNASDLERQAEESCSQWISKNVSGVFFAPLETWARRTRPTPGSRSSSSRPAFPWCSSTATS